MRASKRARWGALAAGLALAFGASAAARPASADVRIGINLGPPGYYVPYYHSPYYYAYPPPAYYPYPYGPYYRAYPYSPRYRYYRDPYHVPYYERHRRYYH